MPPSNQTSLYSDKLESYFTNAEHLRDVFTSMLKSTDGSSKKIFVLHGVGGIGKSSLLRMFILQCQQLGIPTSRASGDEAASIVDILAQWESDLRGQDTKLPKFSKLLKAYRTIQLKVEEQVRTSQNARREAAGRLGKTAVQAVVSSATATVPVVGPLINDLSTAGTGAVVDWLHNFLSKPDVELLLNPFKQLTDCFLEDLAKATKRQKLLLVIDTFEQATSLDDWSATFIQHLPDNVLFVLASRTMPAWENSWPGWMAHTYIEEVKPMSTEHMRVLVNKYYATMRGGRPNPEQVENIIQFAQGLPLVVASAVRLWVQYGIEDFHAIKPHVVANLVDKLQEGVPSALLPVLRAASILRAFNKDMLQAVLEEDLPDEKYTELQRFPFVRPRNEGLMVHDTVRDMIDENLQFHDPGLYRELHQRAARYFDNQLQALSFSSGLDERWQRLVIEQSYHLLRFDEVAYMELISSLFERALAYTRYQFCNSLLIDLESWNIKDFRLKHRLKYYRCRLTMTEVSPAYVNKNDFEELISNCDIDPAIKWGILYHYAGFVGFTTVKYSNENKYLRKSLEALQSIKNLESVAGIQVLSRVAMTYLEDPRKREDLAKQAIQISERLNQPYYAYEPYVELGHFYLNLRLFPQAESAWNNAVRIARQHQNDNNIATALNCLAHVLMATKRFQEAEHILDSAIHAAGKLPNTLGARMDREMYIKRHYGMLFQLTKNYNKSIQYYLESAEIYRKRRSIGGRLRTIALLCGCLYESNQSSKILELTNEIDSLVPNFDSNEIVVSWYTLQGHLLLDTLLHNHSALEPTTQAYVKSLTVGLEANITVLDEVMSRILWATKRHLMNHPQNSSIIRTVLINVAEGWRDGNSQNKPLIEVEKVKRARFIDGLDQHPLHDPVLNRIRDALTKGIPDHKPAIWLAY